LCYSDFVVYVAFGYHTISKVKGILKLI